MEQAAESTQFSTRRLRRSLLRNTGVMGGCSCSKAGPQRTCILPVQGRQGSAFTESLGEHTDSEAGTAQGTPDKDVSGIAASDRSPASRAASGESQRQHDSMAAPCVYDGFPSVVVASRMLTFLGRDKGDDQQLRQCGLRGSL